MKLKVKKTRNNAKVPVVAHPNQDNGYDMYFAGSATISIAAGEQKKLETGWIMEHEDITLLSIREDGEKFPLTFKVGLIAKQPSGLALKRSLDVKAGVIDPSFRGEVEILLYNYGRQPQFILPGEKIAQLVPVLCLTGEVEVVDELSTTDRGAAGWGSGHQSSLKTITEVRNEHQLELFDENPSTDN